MKALCICIYQRVGGGGGAGRGRTGFFPGNKSQNTNEVTYLSSYSSIFFFINICSVMRPLDDLCQTQGVKTPWPCSCGSIVYPSIAEH